jgi:hypothetical protein
MGAKYNNVKYFLRGEAASIIWDPKANCVVAMSSPAGVFATVDKHVVGMLDALGYKAVDRERLEELGFTAPAPDRVDFTVKKDSPKYTKFDG